MYAQSSTYVESDRSAASGVEIAERVGCSEPTVVRGRSRLAEHGLAGLDDAPRSGKPPQVPVEVSQSGLASCLVG